AFAHGAWRPTVTARDIAGRAGIALISIPTGTEIAGLVQAIVREIGGGAERALGRAEQGLAAVLAAEAAGSGGGGLRAAIAQALGTRGEFRPWPAERTFAAALDDTPGRAGAHGAPGPPPARGWPAAPPAGDWPAPLAGHRPGARDAVAGRGAEGEVSAQVVVGETPVGSFIAADAHGDLGVAAWLVLHAAALAAGRLLDLARQAREVPVRSRSELLAELLMSDSAINEDLLGRARPLGVPVGGWHVVVRIEADDLRDAEPDEVQRFELLEAAGQAALQAAAATGGAWYLSRIARAIVLVRITTSNPGPQAGARAARSAERALEAIRGRPPAPRFRAGGGP